MKLVSISNGGFILEGTPATSSYSQSPLASPNSSSSVTTALSGSVTNTVAGAMAAGAVTGTGNNGQNLKCPRCNSLNAKFCYYNNCNLMQPRHFCKTCCRYWTKGGTLRNVPIGGGCRKNKTSSVSSSVAKSGTAKFKSLASVGSMGGLDHGLPSNVWALPHSSQVVALVRGTPFCPIPSPSPNPSPLMKEEVNMFRASIMAESAMMARACQMSTSHQLVLDLQSRLPSTTMCSSFWSNSQQQGPLQQEPANHQSHQKGYMLSEAQNSNTVETLYQRLKLSTGEYNSEQSPTAAPSSCGVATPPSTSSVLASAPPEVGGDQLGYWSVVTQTSAGRVFQHVMAHSLEKPESPWVVFMHFN